MNVFFHILNHELKKILSDKKLLLSMLVVPILLVFITSFISFISVDNSVDNKASIYALNNVEGQLNTNVKIISVQQSSIEEFQKCVKIKPSDVVIGMQDDAFVIYYTSSDPTSCELASFCEQLLYNTTASKYAKTEKLSLIETTDLNDYVDMNSIFISSIIPYMLILLLFQNTSNFAINTIAGEKESGIFEKTLLAPIEPIPVIMGKVWSSTICGLTSCVFYFAIIYLSGFVFKQKPSWLTNANLNVEMVLIIFLTSIIFCYFISTIIILESLLAKDIKAAQHFNRILFILVTIGAVASIFRTGDLSLEYYFIPFYNICIFIQDVLYSTVDVWKMLAMTGSLVGCSLIISGITVLLFKTKMFDY